MREPDDIWCDWCGQENPGEFIRFDGVAFCSQKCVNRRKEQDASDPVVGPLHRKAPSEA